MSADTVCILSYALNAQTPRPVGTRAARRTRCRFLYCTRGAHSLLRPSVVRRWRGVQCSRPSIYQPRRASRLPCVGAAAAAGARVVFHIFLLPLLQDFFLLFLLFFCSRGRSRVPSAPARRRVWRVADVPVCVLAATDDTRRAALRLFIRCSRERHLELRNFGFAPSTPSPYRSGKTHIASCGRRVAAGVFIVNVCTIKKYFTDNRNPFRSANSMRVSFVVVTK